MGHVPSNLHDITHKAVLALFIESPLVVGLAVHSTWLFLAVLLIASSSEHTGLANPNVPEGLLFTALFSGTCLFAGFGREYITRYLRRKWIHLAIGCTGAVGALLATWQFSAEAPTPATALSCTGFALSAIYGGFATVLWGEAARRREPTTLTIATLVSLSVAFVATLLIMLEIRSHDELFQLIFTALPLASVMLIYKSQHDNESFLKPQEFVVLDDGEIKAKEGARWVETFHDLRVSRQAFALILGKSGLPFGAVLGYLAFFCVNDLALIPAQTAAYLTGSLLAFAGVALLLAAPFHTQQSEFHLHTAKTLIPACLALLLFSFGTSWLSEPGTARPACAAMLVLLGTVIWLYPAELTQRYRVTSMLTFGFFCGFLAWGFAIAFALLSFTPVAELFEPCLMVACVALMCAGYFFFVSDDQMRAISLRSAEESGSTHASDAERQAHRAPFIQRCQVVADTYLLSHRELEILVLLAKGRKAAYIQKELVIAEGTVRTHMKNIYRKTNVHSQQELMDLVDNTPA